jgi:hypothetical protein
MAITSVDQIAAAATQNVRLAKTGVRTSVATGYFSVIDLAGNPGAGVLAGTNVTAGVVPTDATAGCPVINAFGVGNVGELSRFEFKSSVACRIEIFDLLWKGGAYAFNANQALSAQPSFADRLPTFGGNPDYSEVQIWVEAVTAATGNLAVNCNYTRGDGTTSRSTGAQGIGAAPTLGRCWQLGLQAGDSGVQKIDNVAGSVATVGTFNVLLLRPLVSGRVAIANDGDTFDWMKTGRPFIADNAALIMLVAPDSTSTGVPDVSLQIKNG